MRRYGLSRRMASRIRARFVDPMPGFASIPLFSAQSPASRSLATALPEGGLARGLLGSSSWQLQGLTILQPDATNYPPARHRTPNDIMSEYRATPSRNAQATSSESACGRDIHQRSRRLRRVLPHAKIPRVIASFAARPYGRAMTVPQIPKIRGALNAFLPDKSALELTAQMLAV